MPKNEDGEDIRADVRCLGAESPARCHSALQMPSEAARLSLRARVPLRGRALEPQMVILLDRGRPGGVFESPNEGLASWGQSGPPSPGALVAAL